MPKRAGKAQTGSEDGRAGAKHAAAGAPRSRAKAKSAKAKTSETRSPQPDAAPKPEQTDGTAYKVGDPGEFAANMMQVGAQSQRLLGDFLRRQRERFGREPLDPLNLTGAFLELVKGMAANPAAIVEAQVQLWHDYMELWERTARQLMGGKVEPVVAPATGDKRFRDKDWQENQVFDFIKQSYLLTANWLQDTVAKVEGLDPKSRRRRASSTPSNSPTRSRPPISS